MYMIFTKQTNNLPQFLFILLFDHFILLLLRVLIGWMILEKIDKNKK